MHDFIGIWTFTTFGYRAAHRIADRSFVLPPFTLICGLETEQTFLVRTLNKNN
jgi:hypothetical protein